MKKKLNPQKLLYIASGDGIGVQNKIDGYCLAAEKAGMIATKIIEDCHGYKQRKQLVRRILDWDGKYVMVRSFSSYNIFFFHIFLLARLQGKILILDQPSPICTYMKEIGGSERSFLWKLSKWTLSALGGLIGITPFHRIIQYADEAPLFLIFSRRKTIVVGNGIDINRINLRKKNYPDGTICLKMIAVAASINMWHGYDRIVRAMYEWNQKQERPTVYFDIVGDDNNSYAKSLKEMVQNYSLTEQVFFHGLQDANYINELYGEESLAIGSLGIYRKGLTTSSVLKVREYCLAGIPFIACGNDPDFLENVPFRFVVSNDNEITDILHVFNTFWKKRVTFTDDYIRQYAINNLSFDIKFKEIIKGL